MSELDRASASRIERSAVEAGDWTASGEGSARGGTWQATEPPRAESEPTDSTGNEGITDRVMSTATQKATDVADQASIKIDAGMGKAAEGLGSLAQTLRDRSDSMPGGQVQAIAQSAADKIETGAELLRQKDTGELVADLEQLVRNRPVESLLVAAGVGFLLSRAVR
jgi:hypothetical protein